MKKFFAMMLALVMVLSLAACGEKTPADDGAADGDEVKTFVMGIDPEYPPFSYIDDNGEYSGFDVEVCKAACELLGWNFEVFGVNWDQKLVQLDAMECDCIWSGMTILDSMKEAGYVLSAPYYYNTQVILVKEDSGITSSADLAGKIVSVQLGTSGESLLNEGGDLEALAATFAELSTTDSFIKCFADLDGNAVDAVFVLRLVDSAKEGYFEPSTGHSVECVPSVEPTCLEAGMQEYWYCSVCDKYYENDDCTVETIFQR